MSQLFPNYTRLPLEIAAGKGSYVTDTQGRRYLDFTSGIGVANLCLLYTSDAADDTAVV